MVWLVDAGTFVRGLDRGRVTEAGEVKPHWGIDVSGARRTPVRAVLDGTFLWRRWISGYGITVAIRHNESLSTFYAHLDEADDLGENASVTAGMMVGRMGDTTAGMNDRGELEEPRWAARRIAAGRRPIGVHLHWEVHRRGTPLLGDRVERLDPVRWLRNNGVDMTRPT